MAPPTTGNASAVSIRFIPRLPWARSAFFALFIVLPIVELTVGKLTETLGTAGGVVFAATAVVMFSFLTAVAVAERPRPILLDAHGFSILGLPSIQWDAVKSVRLQTRSTTYSRFTQLVITLKDPARLSIARARHSGPFDLSPTRRRAERRHPTVVRVTLPRRTIPPINTFLEGPPGPSTEP